MTAAAPTPHAAGPATPRPYVLLSCAMSIDGYIDDASDQRLLLSNEADLDRVDAVRAGCDAILVGAATVRADDPRLVIRSPQRRRERADRGLPPSPTKVTVTGSGDLDPAARFFTVGDAERVVYCATSVLAQTRHRLDGLATVADGGDPVDPCRVLADLATRGVRRLMVEGGAAVHALFLGAGLADELHLVVAPFFVGDRRAPRFPGEGRFPWHPGRRAGLAEVRQIGDVVLLRYALSGRCPDV
ncbi:dihydrofolate reductase family protein [Micromonospora sp. WMMD712]|uniref:RibD family protein n=1 Tax=Micromonospora sp. WMMD712 TaxID=3016096 RepID=UPI00249C878D|nr:dihydrofolate reductase family protein [Micromonospora sp. WMMD712]WFE55543.1 dihydrofolate reductase family protein [Micromonospora sp. WMMD712]